MIYVCRGCVQGCLNFVLLTSPSAASPKRYCKRKTPCSKPKRIPKGTSAAKSPREYSEETSVAKTTTYLKQDDALLVLGVSPASEETPHDRRRRHLVCYGSGREQGVVVVSVARPFSDRCCCDCHCASCLRFEVRRDSICDVLELAAERARC